MYFIQRLENCVVEAVLSVGEVGVQSIRPITREADHPSGQSQQFRFCFGRRSRVRQSPIAADAIAEQKLVVGFGVIVEQDRAREIKAPRGTGNDFVSRGLKATDAVKVSDLKLSPILAQAQTRNKIR